MQLNLNLLIATVALITTGNSRAALGWTVEETIAHYGQPYASDVWTGGATKEYFFHNVDGHDGSHYVIDVYFFQGKLFNVTYCRFDADDKGIDIPELLVKSFQEINVPGAVWKYLGKKTPPAPLLEYEKWTTGELNTASETVAILFPARLGDNDRHYPASLEISNHSDEIAVTATPTS
jgi:hypothetical protein